MDAMGDRLKDLESRETSRKFLPQLPVIARLDGRSFSKYTKKLPRPYCEVFMDNMFQTTRYLVEKTHALFGYHQSDEITLLFYGNEIFFNGKIFKMTSNLASLATGIFIRERQMSDVEIETDNIPSFDCRVFQVPTKEEAANCFLWRELDATKNAITMAASAYYSHNELMHKNGSEKQEMLFQKGINFNDYPASFKRGTFVARKTITAEMDDETWNKIPDDKKPDSRTFVRHYVDEIGMPPFSKVTNRVGVLFDGEKPEVSKDD